MEETIIISCGKCKKFEDEFLKTDTPEEYGWTFYRNKWLRPSCSYELNKKK